MKEAVRWASAAAEGMARDPPGWKSFWMSIRSRVVMVALSVILRCVVLGVQSAEGRRRRRRRSRYSLENLLCAPLIFAH